MAELAGGIEIPNEVYDGVTRWDSIGSTRSYIMRGWRPGTLDYEYWTATGSPNADNPSGQPIVDITIDTGREASRLSIPNP